MKLQKFLGSFFNFAQLLVEIHLDDYLHESRHIIISRKYPEKMKLASLGNEACFMCQ